MDPLRTEIKSWERSFKAQNGRDPTIKDIKLIPSIGMYSHPPTHTTIISSLHPAEKYKLYKKLSKSKSTPLQSTSVSDPPSTPPRQCPPSRVPHLLLSHSRTLETTAPLSTFNPFSPQKNKGKQKEVPAISSQSRSNPFGSPVKAKSTPESQSQLPPAPHVPQPSASSLLSTSSPPAPTNAVSRARKRLRGEPVSPSPNKDKRRRVGSQSTLSFHSLLPHSSTSDDEDSEADLSFVTDSPIKAPVVGTKSFKLLFDDSKSRPGPTKDISLAPTRSTSQGLFGRRSTSIPSDEELEWGLDENTGTRGFNGMFPESGKRTTKLIRNHTTAQAHKSNKRTAPNTIPSEKRPSAKRSQPDTDTEYEVSNDGSAKGPSLLPPSPPAPDSTGYHAKEGNKRPRADTVTRKKTKMTNEQDELDDDDDEADDLNNSKVSVKIVNRTQPRNERGLNAAGADDDFDYGSDPILAHVLPRGSVSSLVIEPGAKQEDGRFEVDLPDKLRQVLALESSKARDFQTESVVKGLLYGRRAANYDPIKGGEIWDVGEDNRRCDDEGDVQRDTEGEDDWEGEPIPWEVGEL